VSCSLRFMACCRSAIDGVHQLGVWQDVSVMIQVTPETTLTSYILRLLHAILSTQSAAATTFSPAISQERPLAVQSLRH
jgi:hypothetical protein